MFHYRIIVLAIAAALVSAGCQMVPVEEGSEKVRVIEEAEANSCERVGNTKVKVLEKVMFMGRSEEKMANDLAKLARNEAVEMGANAVMAEGEITEGSRRFGVYRCP